MRDIVLNTGTGLKDFLSALVAPLQTKTTEMLAFETDAKKRAKFNGRKMVLQAALNDIFGITVAPFILVENTANDGNGVYFFNNAELTPNYIYNDSENQPFYIFNDAEVTDITYDFKVLIPSGIWTAELERRVRAETNLYKLAGTNFIIEQY